MYIYFDPAHYTVFENVGQFAVKLIRDGPLSCSVAVRVKTEDGTATGGSDYIEIDEEVQFAPGEETKEVRQRSKRFFICTKVFRELQV